MDDEKSKFSNHGALFRFFRHVWMLIFPFDREEWDILITSGPEMTRRMTSAFNGLMAKNGEIVELGNPRADCILSQSNTNVLKPFARTTAPAYIICYAPTFRGESSALELFESLDKEDLSRFLKKWNAQLLIKLHYIDRQWTDAVEFPARVHLVTDEELEDINSLLPHVDILITDYSSVFFDYLLVDRPILFSAFDMETYLSKERGMYEPYNDATPGPVCVTWQEVIAALEKVLRGEDSFHKERELQQNRFFTHLDVNNSLRITEYVKSQLAEK